MNALNFLAIFTKLGHIWAMLAVFCAVAYLVEHNETAERLLFKVAAKLGLDYER